jgi:acyl-CoA reductase-like NAD-dependent aldehyde dehydrogenase
VLSIDPVIGAIVAGNAVVLKPSELAPATSELFAKLLPEYVDNSCIKVVEGAVPETTALLEQKWDKILYTGISIFCSTVVDCYIILHPFVLYWLNYLSVFIFTAFFMWQINES